MLASSAVDSPSNISKTKVSQMATMFSSIMHQNRGFSISKKETQQQQSQGTSSAITKNRFVKNKITTTTNKQSTFYGRCQTTTRTTTSSGSTTKISASTSSLIHQRSLSSSSLYSNPSRNDNETPCSSKYESQNGDPSRNKHSNLMLRENDEDQEQRHQVISSSCHDISLLIDNKAKFCSAKALFEQLEKQSNLMAVKSLRSAEKLVISSFKMYNSRHSDQALALPSTTNRPSLRPPQLPPRHFNELMFTGGNAVILNGFQKKLRPSSVMVISEGDKNGHDGKNINNNNVMNNDHKIVGNSTSAGSVFTLIGSPKISTMTTKSCKEESVEEKLESKTLDFTSFAAGVQSWKTLPAPPPILPVESFTDRGLVEDAENLRAAKRRSWMEKFVKEECDQSLINATWRCSSNSTSREDRLETKFVNSDGVQKEPKIFKESLDCERSADLSRLKNGEIKSHSSLDTFVRGKMSSSGENVEQESSTCNNAKSIFRPANEIMPLLRLDDEDVDSKAKNPEKATLMENAVFKADESTTSTPEIHYLPDGHFWMEIPGLAESSSSCSSSPQNSMRYKKPTKVSFSGQCIK
uniref:Uncharacterized protein n=1 Tax=Romanomermis culicivorax TaxID=13658 RepID=A0A915IVE4_ROMCU